MNDDELNQLIGVCPPPTAAPSASGTVPPGADGGGIVVSRLDNTAGMGAFEAANRFDKSIALWSSPIMSADATILPDKYLVDGRTADMLRNDSYAQGGATLRKDNIVGSHFLPNARPSLNYLSRQVGKEFDETWEAEFQEESEETFDLYAESPDCWLDASRKNTLTGLTRMNVGIHMAAGETLSTVEWDRTAGGDFRTMIQQVDLARLSTDPASSMDQTVRGGIRHDTRGAPIAYQILTEHPNDVSYNFRDLPKWVEVPIRRPWGRLQVIHLHEQIMPGQSRGISEVASALKAMKMGHNLRDISLQRLVTQAMYAATITSEIPTEQIYASLGGITDAKAVQKAITEFSAGYLGSVAEYSGAARNLQIDGVKIPHLYPGTKLDLLSPGKDTVSGTEFEQSLLRYIAASMGVSYEQLSRDYTHTNYASARAAMAETWKFMQSQKKIIADKFASIVWRLWIEEAMNNNRLTTLPASKAGRFYTGGRLNLAFDALSRVEWIGASRGQIDELKETEAAIARIDAGLSTREDELARLGKDFRKVFRQLAREEKMRVANNLTFGVVPRGQSATANDATEGNQAA